MKKILVFLGILLVMSGCAENTEKLSCDSTTTSNGVTTTTRYDIDYQKDDVKKVTITYDYTQDTTGNTTTNDGNTTNDATNNGNTTNDTNNTATQSREKQDGVNSDSDGLTEENDSDKNLKSDDVVDGVVGDAIDGTVDGVTNTILDLAGIRTTLENQMSTYNNIKGFSYKVDKNIDNEYKVIYSIDMDKISDNDLSRFNIPTRDFSDLKKNYQDLGYTCK